MVILLQFRLSVFTNFMSSRNYTQYSTLNSRQHTEDNTSLRFYFSCRIVLEKHSSVECFGYLLHHRSILFFIKSEQLIQTLDDLILCTPNDNSLQQLAASPTQRTRNQVAHARAQVFGPTCSFAELSQHLTQQWQGIQDFHLSVAPRYRI